MTSPTLAPPRRAAPPLPRCSAAAIRSSLFAPPSRVRRAALWVSVASALAGCDIESSIEQMVAARIPDRGVITAPPVYPSTPPPEALDALAALRAEQGLPPLVLAEALAEAAQAHAAFLGRHETVYATTGLSWHLERPDLTGFLGIDPTARAAASGHAGPAPDEVIAARPNGAVALRDWLDSLYHRVPLLTPHGGSAGYGVAAGGDFRYQVLVVAAEPGDAAPGFALYPPPGADDVDPAWEGNELPQPPAPPQGYPSGPVVSVHTAASAIAVAHASLTADGSEVPVAAQVLTRATDANLAPGVAALLPDRPLDPDTLYEAVLRGTADGAAFEHRWTFRTAPASCSPFEDRCGLGRACQPVGADARCLPVGKLAPGEACEALTDCREGFTCVGGACAPFCDPAGEGENACDACVRGSALLEAGFGVCF